MEFINEVLDAFGNNKSQTTTGFIDRILDTLKNKESQNINEIYDSIDDKKSLIDVYIKIFKTKKYDDDYIEQIFHLSHKVFSGCFEMYGEYALGGYAITKAHDLLSLNGYLHIINNIMIKKNSFFMIGTKITKNLIHEKYPETMYNIYRTNTKSLNDSCDYGLPDDIAKEYRKKNPKIFYAILKKYLTTYQMPDFIREEVLAGKLRVNIIGNDFGINRMDLKYFHDDLQYLHNETDSMNIKDEIVGYLMSLDKETRKQILNKYTRNIDEIRVAIKENDKVNNTKYKCICTSHTNLWRVLDIEFLSLSQTAINYVYQNTKYDLVKSVFYDYVT